MSRPYDRKNGSAARVTPAAKDQWYVLHVLSNKERRAVENLKRLFKEDEEMGALVQSDPLVPTEKVEEVRNGKKYVQERKLYPGYVYLNFALRRADGTLNNDAWYKIQAVDGVISFACGRNKEPLPMSAKDVRDLMSEIERRSEGPRQKIVFNVKDEVVVLEGAFQGEHGIVEEVDAERGKLRVGVTMFGRSNPLDLDYTQVQLVPEEERGKAELPK
ncbi:MAG: transcription termination/antitermination factor NusG [Akkermansia sp.]|nr:transcription termination/antitermination factor NusG [Akkermansia sp.]MBQ7022674.1 transcription termination/antitermination factor NusG [Akkermansia sp.]